MTDQAPELLPSDMIGDYKALPESFRKHIINLEIFIGDCDNESELDTDGATKALNGIIVELLCSLALTRPPSERPVAQVREDETTMLPERTVAQWFLDNHQEVDLSILDDLTDLVRRARVDGQRLVAPQMREALEQSLKALCDLKNAVEKNGTMNGREYVPLGIQVNDAIDRAKYAAALTAERPEAVRENLTAEEFAQVLPRPEAAVAWTMTKEQLEHLVYEEVEADVETEADATNAFQEGYSVGFNDCRFRVLKRLLERAIQHEEPGRETNHSPPHRGI